MTNRFLRVEGDPPGVGKQWYGPDQPLWVTRKPKNPGFWSIFPQHFASKLFRICVTFFPPKKPQIDIFGHFCGVFPRDLAFCTRLKKMTILAMPLLGERGCLLPLTGAHPNLFISNLVALLFCVSLCGRGHKHVFFWFLFPAIFQFLPENSP